MYADRRKAKDLAERLRALGKEGITIAIINVRQWRAREWWRVLDIFLALGYCRISLHTQAAIDATESEYLVYG